MTELAKHTWIEARDLLGPDTVAVLPIGCTEPHGPHLPLDTDVTIALAQSRRAVERLQDEDIRALLLPPLSYGVTMYTDGFAGRLTLRPGTLWAVLEDIVSALEQHDVRQVVFSNGHLEPAHVEVLRGVALDHAERKPGKAQVLFPDNTRRRWAATLGEEFASGDCHAGRYESAIVMAADPAAVRETLRRGLPPVEIGLLAKMKAGVGSFLAAGAKEAYCGAPAAASVNEGEDLIERLAEMLVVSVRETWPDLWR